MRSLLAHLQESLGSEIKSFQQRSFEIAAFQNSSFSKQQPSKTADYLNSRLSKQQPFKTVQILKQPI